MVAAIIFADFSQLIGGTAIPMLPLNNGTFLESVTTALRNARISDIVVLSLGIGSDHPSLILPPHSREIRIRKDSPVSLKEILETLPHVPQNELHGCLFVSADQPLLAQREVVALLHAFWTSDAEMVSPVIDGKREMLPLLAGAKLLDRWKNETAALHQASKSVPSEIIREVSFTDRTPFLSIRTESEYRSVVDVIHREKVARE